MVIMLISPDRKRDKNSNINGFIFPSKFTAKPRQ